MNCKSCDEKNPPGTNNCLYCLEPLPEVEEASAAKAFGGMIILGLFVVALGYLGLWGWGLWQAESERREALAEGKKEVLMHQVCFGESSPIRDNDYRGRGYYYEAVRATGQGLLSGSDSTRHCYRRTLKSSESPNTLKGGEVLKVYR